MLRRKSKTQAGQQGKDAKEMQDSGPFPPELPPTERLGLFVTKYFLKLFIFVSLRPPVVYVGCRPKVLASLLPTLDRSNEKRRSKGESDHYRTWPPEILCIIAD